MNKTKIEIFAVENGWVMFGNKRIQAGRPGLNAHPLIRYFILTAEEYNSLKNEQDHLHLRVGEMVADYQRKFRLALGNELIGACRHACGLSVEDVKKAIERAEETAKRIQ